MINVGWDANRLYRLHQLLLEPHRVDVSVYLLDLNHNWLGDLSDVLMTGNVQMDTTGDITRSAEVTLVDPFHQLGLDPSDPGSAIFATRMIQIIYSVGELDGSYWYNVPIFTGPVDKVSRNGVFITVEAVGKEALASNGLWDGRTVGKNVPKVWAMMILLNQAGEAFDRMNVSVARLDAMTRTSMNLKPGSDNTPWKQVKKIANSIGYHVFYDGAGTFQAQPWDGNAKFVFDEAYLTSPVSVSYNLDDLRNAVQITGGTPKGAANPLVARVMPPVQHPLSPWSLGRNGVGRIIPEFQSDDDLNTQEDVDERAWNVLVNLLMGALTMSCDAIAVPHLEEGDLLIFSTPSFYGVNRLNQMTIPLSGAPTMSLGYDDKYRKGALAWKRWKGGKKPRKTRSSDRKNP